MSQPIHDPIRENIYEAFDNYFSSPLMTKIKNVDGCSVYMSKTYCLLSRECRYLVAIISGTAREVGYRDHLSNLKWVSFQTRTLPDKHDLLPHSYQVKREGILVDKISRVSKDKESSTYQCNNLPLILTILHTTTSPYEYQDQGTVMAALETYKTIVSWVS